MIESERGCGYRSVGGLYLRGIGIAVGCDRLPFILDYCPVCGAGIQFSRGYQMIDWFKYAGYHQHKIIAETEESKNPLSTNCDCDQYCPICYPKTLIKHAIMWVGDKYYSPSSFIAEAEKQGISKKIATVPRDIKIGETWILLAHKKAGSKMVPDEKKTNGNNTIIDPPMKEIKIPAVFYAFRPTHIEKIITKKQARNKKLVKDLRDRGITPVVAKKVDRKTGHVLETEVLEEK